MTRLTKNKKITYILIASLIIPGVLTLFAKTLFVSADTITVTGSLKADPGFYWCQHQDGSWSTYSSFEDQTYTSPNDNGEPAKKWVKTYANISSKPSTFYDAAGNPYSLSEVSNANPVDADMNGDADPNMQGQPTIVSGQVVIEGYSGQGISGVSNSSICGGNPGMIYSFPVDVFYEAEVQVDLSINPNSQTIDEGNSATYDAFLNEQNVTTDSQTTWSINDTSIATIDQSGNVTGVSGGTTTVTATYEDTQLGVNLTATAEVTVNQSEEPPPKPEPEDPIADFSWSPNSPEANESISFEDKSTHPQGYNIVEWQWSYQGTFSEEQNPDYSFSEKGLKDVTLTVTDENGNTDSITRTVTVEIPNVPPNACITGTDTVYVGDTKYYWSCSSDSDGYIAEYYWDTDNRVSNNSSFNKENGQITFNEEGTVELWHGVLDNRGKMSEAIKEITVKKPIPEANLKINGELKENRKVTFDISSSKTFGQTQMLWDLSEITITPMDNQDINTIQYNGTLNGVKQKNVQFSTHGMYEVQVKVENDYGYTDTYKTQIYVREDYEPNADFESPSPIYREEGTNVAIINLSDKSTSKDDTIEQRIWTITFDSDNDGNFNDESPKTINNNNEININYDINQNIVTGKYKVELTVIENDFSNEAITEFHQPSHILRDKTSKIIEVDNIQPTTEFDVSKKNFVDLTFAIGNTQYSKSEIQSKLNQYLIPEFEKEGIEASINFKVYPERTNKKVLKEYAPGTVRLSGVADNNYIAYSYGGDSYYDQGSYMYNLSSNSAYRVDRYAYPDQFAQYSSRAMGTEYVHNMYHAGYEHLYEYYLSYSSMRSERIATAYREREEDVGFILGDGGHYIAKLQDHDTAPYEYHWNGVYNIHLWNRDDNDKWYDEMLSVDGRTLFYLDGNYSGDTNPIRSKTWDSNGNVTDAHWYGIYADYLLQVTPNGWLYYAIENGNDYDIYRVHKDTKEKEFVFSYTSEDYPEESNFIVSSDGYWHYVLFSNAESSYATNYEWRYWGEIKRFGINGEEETIVSFPKDSNRVPNAIGLIKDTIYYGFQNQLIGIEKIKSVDLLNALNTTTWNDNANSYIIPVEDELLKDLSESDTKDKIIEKLTLDNIDYLALGTNSNKGQHNSVVNDVNVEGAYFDNTNLDSAIQSLTNRIVNDVVQPQSKEITITLEDQVEYFSSYSDFENDPKYKGRYKYTHNAGYYENTQGVSQYHEQSRQTPIKQFDKVGQYLINSQAQDNPVNTNNSFSEYRKWSDETTLKVNVHRKPISDFKASVDSNTNEVYIVDNSYDLDSYSQGEKGIYSKTWRYRRSGTTSWSIGKPTTLNSSYSWEIELKVLDFQSEEAISRVVTNRVTAPPNQPPKAGFTHNSPIGVGEQAQIRSTASDPDGDTLTINYKVTDPDGNVKWYNNQKDISFTGEKIGFYIIEQQVNDGNNPTEIYSDTVEVSNTPPVADFSHEPVPNYTNPTPYFVGDTVRLISKARDNDLDPLDISFKVITPNGNTLVTYQETNVVNYNSVTFDFQLPEETGQYIIIQNVSDEKTANCTTCEKRTAIYVKELEIQGVVKHTNKWLQRHQELGTSNVANSFFSGERFMLEANVTNYDGNAEVNVILNGIQEDGNSISLDTTLNNTNHPVHSGSIHDERMATIGTRLKKGSIVTFQFRSTWSNGMEKQVDVSIQIIGDVFEILNIQRTN